MGVSYYFFNKMSEFSKINWFVSETLKNISYLDNRYKYDITIGNICRRNKHKNITLR